MSKAPAPKLFHPRFEASFNLGQVAQIVSVLAAVIGAYFAMSADIRRLDDRASLKFDGIDKRLGAVETAFIKLTDSAIIAGRMEERIAQTSAELNRLRAVVDQALRNVSAK